jgi:hypothetical protein
MIVPLPLTLLPQGETSFVSRVRDFHIDCHHWPVWKRVQLRVNSRL